MRQRLIIWGAGALGERVGQRWADGPVFGITRTENRHGRLRLCGIQPYSHFAPEEIQPNDRLLLALPGHLRQNELLAKLRPFAPPRRIIFISSTGYHGFPTGQINENTPPGQDKRCQAIAKSEQVFREWAGHRGVVLRLGGLYSANRGPFAALKRKGLPAAKPADRPLPLLHYDDAATAVLNALHHLRPEPVYLGVTPPCPTRQEFYEAACRRLNLPLPPFQLSRGLPTAVWDVSRWQRDLLPEPAYPNWRQGIFENS